MPRIFIISRPTFTDEHSKFLNSSTMTWKKTRNSTAAEQLIEFAGRICYLSFGVRQSNKSTAEYIGHLIKQGHESVLEHANWTFLLDGVSRAFTHQLVRHRPGFAYSQLSQQYHDESAATFIEPFNIKNSKSAYKAWTQGIQASRTAYNRIINSLERSLGQKPSKETLRMLRTAARSVLPNATETKIVVTANARAIRHFLTVRGSIEGDYEMRAVCKLLYDAVVTDAPNAFSDFRSRTFLDGTPQIVKVRLKLKTPRGKTKIKKRK